MKLDKAIVQRRLDLMEAEGIVRLLHFCDLSFHLLFRRLSYRTLTLVSTLMLPLSMQKMMRLLCARERRGLVISRFPTAMPMAFTLPWNSFRFAHCPFHVQTSKALVYSSILSPS